MPFDMSKLPVPAVKTDPTQGAEGVALPPAETPSHLKRPACRYAP